MKQRKQRKSKLKILHEDKHLIAVYKPPGMLTQGDSTGDPDMLSETRKYLRVKSRSSGFAGMVHRLDRPASGVLVFAADSKTAAKLSEQFKEHSIRKFYLAVVHGDPGPEGILKDRLEKRPRAHKSVVTETNKGKPSQLIYRTLEVRKSRSLVLVQLITGRSHQIRVQFSSRGFPIVGDRKYGSREVLRNPGMIALCAYQIVFKHPGTGRNISIRSIRPNHWPWYAPHLFTMDCTELDF